MTTHSIDFRIYYEDTDAGGIVYHAQYLSIAERARTEAIRAMGETSSTLLADFGLLVVVRRASVDFRTPLRLDDIATVVTRLDAISAVRCTLTQRVQRGDELCATVVVELTCISKENGRPARFPPRWHDLLTGLGA